MDNVIVLKMHMEDNVMNANPDIGIFPTVNLVYVMDMRVHVMLKLGNVLNVNKQQLGFIAKFV